MSTSTTPMASASSGYNTPVFWARLWRTSGIHAVVFFVIAYAVYGLQPGGAASADSLVAFYEGGRTWVLIAAVLAGMATLNLMWFAAALRAALSSADLDGWAGAVTASSAAVGALLLLLITMGAALAYSGAGNSALASGLNDFAWASVVLSSFPRAMLIMAGSFGLWRARLISSAWFAAGVTVVVLVLLGGTTWLTGGFWAPDGAYSRFVSPILGLAWVAVVSRILVTRGSEARTGW